MAKPKVRPGRSKTRRAAKRLGRRSGFEVKVEEALHAKVEDHVEYEQDSFTYQSTHKYWPDFKVWEGDHVRCYVEAKGRFTSRDRTKMLAVKKAHPEIDLRLVLQRDNYLYRGAKSRYSDWCRDHGFVFSIWPALPV